MIAYVKFRRDDKDKQSRQYYCARCGSFITDSRAIVRLDGSEEHSFVNPAGILCNFITFGHCDNVLVHSELYIEHSWFAGYGWRFLLCGICSLHLGWKYDALKNGLRPTYFYGVLIDGVETVTHEPK